MSKSVFAKSTQEIYAILEPNLKKKFLASLSFYLSEFARSVYPEAKEGNQSAIDILITINEMIHTTTKQVLQQLGLS